MEGRRRGEGWDGRGMREGKRYRNKEQFSTRSREIYVYTGWVDF